MVTKKEVEDIITTLSTNITATFKKMLDDSINEIKNTIIENLKASNENLQLRVTALEKEIKSMKVGNIEFEKRTEAALQHARLEQIIISGIPAEVVHDDLEAMAINILNQIKIDETAVITSRDIAACHRLGKGKDIILRFVNRKHAVDCLENRAKLRDFNREVVGLTPETNIFINENLSPYMSKLAYCCRVLKRQKQIDKVTTFKGVVKISMTIGNRMVSKVIGHLNDLEKIFPNMEDLFKED